MHLATKIGVFDIVQAQPPDDGDGAVYQVSAHERVHLERLLAVAGFQREIAPSAEAATGFHIAVGQRDLFDIMSALAETVDYDRLPPR